VPAWPVCVCVSPRLSGLSADSFARCLGLALALASAIPRHIFAHTTYWMPLSYVFNSRTCLCIAFNGNTYSAALF
jgi:hypothetical protein